MAMPRFLFAFFLVFFVVSLGAKTGEQSRNIVVAEYRS